MLALAPGPAANSDDSGEPGCKPAYALDRGEFVRVMRVATIRRQPLPFVGQTQRDLAADEWVTRVLRVRKVKPASLIPILRPRIPQHGHLVADQASNTVLFVGRYANVQRVAKLIRTIDDNARSDWVRRSCGRGRLASYEASLTAVCQAASWRST